MENGNRKRVKLISNIASVAVVVGIIVVLVVLGRDQKEKPDEDETFKPDYDYDHLLIEDRSYINLKTEGIDAETLAAAYGDYIFAVHYEEFFEYSINVYKANGADTSLVNNINLKDNTIGTPIINDYFAIKDLFVASDKLVVICGIGTAKEDNLGIHERDGQLKFTIPNSSDKKEYVAYVFDEKLELVESHKAKSEKEGLNVINYTDVEKDVSYSWTEDKLLSVGLYNGNVRLTMYDVSNPEEYVPETYVYLSESMSVDTLHKERKALVDSKRNIFCIGVSSYDDASQVGVLDGISYYIYAYEEGMFEKKAYVYYPTYKVDYKYGSIDTMTTGICIGECFYVINTGGEMSVISLETFGISELTF